MATDSGNSGGWGCVSFVLFCIVAWALLFGVTVGTKHYGLIGCDAANGVKLEAP